MSNIQLVKDNALKLMAEASAIKKEMDELSEWDSLPEIIDNIKDLYGVLHNIVLFVEKSAKGLLVDVGEIATSEDKLNAAVDIADDMLKFPFYIDMFDGPVLKIIISMVVNFVNDKLGSEWSFADIEK